MGTFSTSTGERLSKANIDANIRVAKSVFVSENLDRQYCWACGSTQARLTCSHIISVNQCQNDGRAEIAWCRENLAMECISCHLQTETRNFNHHANARTKKDFIEFYEQG